MRERLPEVVDELMLVRRRASRERADLQRAGLAAARGDCVVIGGPDADLSAIGRFVDALRSGAAGVVAAGAARAG
jgi:hypothetical protein